MSFKLLDPQDVLISAESVTAPAWSSNSATLTSFFTSSVQVAGTSGDFYYSVYNSAIGSDDSEVQFAIGYADRLGSGSVLFNSAVDGKSASSAVYGQYRSLILETEEDVFDFGAESSDYFYFISLDRSRFKQKLLPSTFRLSLKTVGAEVDLYAKTSTTTQQFVGSNRVFDIESRTNGSVTSSVSGEGTYGKLFPDIGVILLNGRALDAAAGSGGISLNTQRVSNSNEANPDKLFLAMSSGSNFTLNVEETVTSNFIFVRARNSEFNYSTNPSLITGSGELRHSEVMVNSPQSFITTVGLYNNQNDLLAVAKLSRPLIKDFTKELLIRIKLDY